MNFSESVQYLYSLGNEMLAVKLELESITALCHSLDNPQTLCPAVHVAGTNGKGSTSAMVEAIARNAGLRVGLYTSPHLVEITERIRVNGAEIRPADFARLATRVRAVSERLVADGTLPAPPTYFEQVTALALLYFVERKVELAILEVGLGGRLDATNICIPLVCAITPISADHQQYLGNTLAAIAAEKAGIVKPHVPVVVAPQEDEVMTVIKWKCAHLAAPLIECGMRAAEDSLNAIPADSLAQAGHYHFHYRTERAEYDVSLNLPGKHQVTNACVAIHLAEQLQQQGLKISQSDITTGLGKVDWPGRLELLYPAGSVGAERLPHLLDGAHNSAGARVLRDFLDEHCHMPVTLIFGLMSDKALLEMEETLFPAAEIIIATHIDNPRAAEAQVIADAAAGKGWQIILTGTVSEALAAAKKVTPRHGLICVCGSLYLVGEVKKVLSAD